MKQKPSLIVESRSKDDAMGFIYENWGAVLEIKRKKKFQCSDEELLKIAVQAYEKALSTYNPNYPQSKKKKNGSYTFLNHFLQYLKTEITQNIKNNKFISFEEAYGTMAVIPSAFVFACSTACLGQFGALGETTKASASMVLKLFDDDKDIACEKAIKAFQMYRDGSSKEEICRYLKVSLEAVEQLIELAEEINPQKTKR